MAVEIVVAWQKQKTKQDKRDTWARKQQRKPRLLRSFKP